MHATNQGFHNKKLRAEPIDSKQETCTTDPSMRFHTTFAALMPTLLLTAKGEQIVRLYLRQFEAERRAFASTPSAASVLNTGISPRQTYDNIYNEENDKQQTDEDIKTLCIDKGGAALWRPKRGESGKANLDSQGEIQDFDVGMTEGATYNWLYGARLAAMRSLAHVSVFPLRLAALSDWQLYH